MMIYLKYAWSQIRHKYLVFRVGLLVKVPLWQLIIHDLSKFSPREFGAYARDKRGHIPGFTPPGSDEFQIAWLWHESRNPHHPGFWVPGTGKHAGEPLPMSENYAREMMADLLAAGRSKTGQWDMTAWFNENGPKMPLHSETLNHIWTVMIELGYFVTDNCEWSWAALEKTRQIFRGLP